MKKAVLTIGFLLMSFIMTSQDITGDWYGKLDVGITSLRMVVHIQKTDKTYSATLDSPDQKAYDIPAQGISFSQDTLKINLANLGAKYEGVYDAKSKSFKGSFTQMGQELPLDLSRDKIGAPKRPQTPKKPYPYHSEDLTFQNDKQNVTLAGTLTYPKEGKDFPAVIMITGSGAQDRNEELFQHKPFLVIADYLTRHGIAVLRYDDRGTAESTGKFETGTTADFATDVEAAFKYLKTRKEINSEKIGLIGHSEGGTIAPIVAAKHPDVDFIVMLAGTSVKGEDILIKQQKLIATVEGKSKDLVDLNASINTDIFKKIENIKDSTKLHQELKSYLKETLEKHPEWNSQRQKGVTDSQFIKIVISSYTTPWMKYFLTYDPAPTLEKIKCPVLVLNGTHDLQVPPDQNLPVIKKALEKGGNTDFTIKRLKGLNHLFQESETGSLSEYAKIEQTFSPKALEIIKDWIIKKTK